MSRLVWIEFPDTMWCREDGPITKAQRKLTEVAHVQNPTVAWARRNGVRATKLQGPGNRSQPDFCFWIPGGVPFMIEFKRPGEAPTPLQTDTIKKFWAADYAVEVHDTKESAIAAIQRRLGQRATIKEVLSYVDQYGLPPKVS